MIFLKPLTTMITTFCWLVLKTSLELAVQLCNGLHRILLDTINLLLLVVSNLMFIFYALGYHKDLFSVLPSLPCTCSSFSFDFKFGLSFHPYILEIYLKCLHNNETGNILILIKPLISKTK